MSERPPRPLRAGDVGDAVRDLQARLARAGFEPGADPIGHFGAGTEAAVRAFQERRGLRVDGICGPQTWASLIEAGLRLGDRLLYLRAPMLRGDDVAELQALLGTLGFDAGRVDGIYGPDTAAAVVEFQRNAGLTTDGIVGPDSVAALQRLTGRVGGPGTTAVVAQVREAEQLRRPRELAGLRVAVAEAGGLGALAEHAGRLLRDGGAVVTVLVDPDGSARAAAANAFEADAFVEVALRDEPGAGAAYYAREGYESAGGHRLADLLLAELARAGLEVAEPRGMRLPVLRETRMPAVVVELGPPPAAVLRLPDLAAAIAAAVSRWVTSPAEA